MIQQETHMVRKDGVTLVRTWSDLGVMIENESGVRYAEAVDVTPLAHSYRETDEKIPEESHDTEHEEP